MKKFLSLILAVLMVVSVMVPMLTVFVSAEGESSNALTPSEKTQIPELIITETCTNAVSYHNVLAACGIYKDVAQPRTYHYTEALIADGVDVSKYYTKSVINGNTVFTQASGTKKAGVQYYWRSDLTGDVTEVVEYFELYNASDKPLNIYDYKLVRDTNANVDGTTVTFWDITPGGVNGAKHGGYFQNAGTDADALREDFAADTYYYRNSDDSIYIPVKNAEDLRDGVNYYVWETEGYFATNPDYEDGWLQPGELVVIWNFNDASWKSFLTLDMFKQYYSTVMSPKSEENPDGTRDYYKVDLDNVLTIAVDGCTGGNAGGYSTASAPRYSARGTGYWLDEWGQYLYGVAPKNMNSTLDSDRFTKWTSWVFWGSHAGFNPAQGLTKQAVSVGTTVVTGGDYLVYDEQSGDYRKVSIADGTADANGCAVPGVDYYYGTLDKVSGNNLLNKTNEQTVNYLYGMDTTVPDKEGVPYTVGSDTLTPGILTNAQKLILPNYTTGDNVVESVPDIVITEVVPDNTGEDFYEFLEVVNTSGRAINIYDYSVGVSTDYRRFQYECFHKINTIIPGDIGNILTADPGSIYYDLAPTNPNYEDGWLQPGEVAVLWSYYSSCYTIGATFADFRNYFKMGDDVKLFAMDADNSAYSGRSWRQNLANSGQYIYGLLENDRLDWYGDIWTSNPILGPVTHIGSGITYADVSGIPLEKAESFVFCNAAMVSCEQNGPGEDKGYQFVWNTFDGIPTRFGMYLDMARMTAYTNYKQFAFTGSVATSDEWNASPGKLIDAQKTEITTNKGDSRYVVYLQEFNNIEASGYAEVAELIGITDPANSILAEEHMANVALTEKNGSAFLEIKDGKLVVTNKGKSDDYMVLMSDEVLASLRNKDFTLEYSMTYAGDNINNKNGYSAVLYNFDGANQTYGAPIVRLSGYGHNAVVRNDRMTRIEDAAGANSMANTVVSGNNSNTLYERLYGELDSVSGFSDSLENSMVMAGKKIDVRVDVSRTYGVTVTVNGVVVSRTYNVAESADFSTWSLFLEETVGSDLALMTTPNMTAMYDYITVYTNSITTNADNMDIPDLYITELNVSGGTNIYVSGSTAKTNLNFIEYIEIANGGNERVNLAEYVIVGTRKDGKLHEGNNLQWLGDTNAGKDENGEYRDGNIYLADWLGNGDYRANLNKDGIDSGDYGWYNPSANEAYLDPGEVAVIFVANGSTKFTQNNKSGAADSFVAAACSWLNIDLNAADAPLCIQVASNQTTVTDVDADNKKIEGTERFGYGICGWDSASCVYGIGRLNDNAGQRIVWKDIYTHDYRYLESLVNLNHSTMLGQNNQDMGSDIGSGGTSLGNQGYSAHYVYGIDASSHYKMGTAFTRRNNPIMTWYKSGSSTVDKSGQYNVGKLYAYQEDTFRSLAQLKKDGYQNGGGLVITEYAFDTTGPNDSVLDVFEALEITNTANRPINLYEYSLVTSGDTNYGSLQRWTAITKFVPGSPVCDMHQLADELQNIQNPDSMMVQPGETIVVWVYPWDAANYVNNEEPDRVWEEEDFRNHWASLGNNVINAKDENGDYVVRMVTAVAHDGANAGNLSNTTIAKAYGIAKNTNMYINGSFATNNVVSYMVSPVHTLHYDMRWAKEQFTPAATGLGINTDMGFEWDELMTEEVDFANDSVLTNLCVKNADGTYSFATAPYDTSVKHYRLYFYWSKQVFSAAPWADGANVSYNFTYGESMTGGWGQANIMAGIKISNITQQTSNPKFDMTADAMNMDARVDVDIISTGLRTNSFGYLQPEQLGMLQQIKFTFVGELDDGTDVYFHDSVVGKLEDVRVTSAVSGVSVSGGKAAISFNGAVSEDYYNKLIAKFGAEAVTRGILSISAMDAMEAGQNKELFDQYAYNGSLRPELLEGYDFIVDDQPLYDSVFGGMNVFYGNAQQMGPGYYSASYSAVGFVQLDTDAFGNITLYADRAASRNITQVAATAMFDYKTEKDEANGYIYETAYGWSKYTAAQINRLQEIIDKTQ